jgi:predicted ATPase
LKKQCVLETHSEYLINRLRYRSAVSDGDDLAKDCIIYFVEKEGLRSNYRPVKINRFGVIEDWPKGFFDEDEEVSASILRAGMEKRKKERKSPDA